MPTRRVGRAVATVLAVAGAVLALWPVSAPVGPRRVGVSCGPPALVMFGRRPPIAATDDEIVRIAYGTSANEIARFAGGGAAIAQLSGISASRLAAAVKIEARSGCRQAARARTDRALILVAGALLVVGLTMPSRRRRDADAEPDNVPDLDVQDAPEAAGPAGTAPAAPDSSP